MAQDNTKSRTFKEMMWVASSKIFTMLVLFLCNVFVARACGTADFALYATCITLVLLIDGVLGAPLDQTIIRFGVRNNNDVDQSHRMTSTLFKIKLLLGVIVIIAAALLAKPISVLLFSDVSHYRLVVIVSCAVLALFASRCVSTFLQLELNFRGYGMLDILQGLFRLLFLGLLIYFSVININYFVCAFGLGSAFAFLIMVKKIPTKYMFSTWATSSERGELIGFSLAVCGGLMLSTLTGRSDIIILSALQSTDTVAPFAVATQFCMLLAMPAFYAGLVVQPRILSISKEGKLPNLVKWSVLGGLISGAMLVLFTFLFGQYIIYTIFGEAYTDAIHVLRILIIGVMLDYITMPVLLIFSLQKFPKKVFKGELVITIFFLGAAFLCAAESGILLAWAVTAIRFLKLLFYFYITFTNMRRVV